MFEFLHRHVFECCHGVPPWAIQLERKMSELSDKIDQIKVSLTEMKARITEDIDELKRQIVAGATTPEILQSLDDINASIKTEDPLPDFPPTAP